MSKEEAVKRLAISVALKSPCNNRHGSVIVQGNRCKALGYNDPYRTTFLGRTDVCQHAEMSAATTLFNGLIRRLPKHKRQRKIDSMTIWSVRVSEGGVLGMALPCGVCLHRLKALGFKRVAFSNKKGDVEIHRLSSLVNTH